MGFTETALQNWYDGRRIEEYCRRHNYSKRDISALREIHRLYLEQKDGSLGGTPQEALETIAKAPESERQIVRAIGQKSGPVIGPVFDALFRLADDPRYANKILSAYRTDVKPNLHL